MYFITKSKNEMQSKKLPVIILLTAFVSAGFFIGTGTASAAATYKVLGWNNLGMHCMDADFSVFCILPPYNTIHVQVIDNQGNLLTAPGNISVTYDAIADLDGSINKTSIGKTNFWQYVQPLFGVSLPQNVGLPVPGPNSFSMPGPNNVPQSMMFENINSWFAAYGIPITPLDDLKHQNSYPLMQLTAQSGNTMLAATDIVLPVSDEMDCRACHASNSGPAARPAAGWVNDPNAQRDYRLNILRLHDERMLSNPLFTSALTTAGYNSNGLYATVINNAKPILCAKCHRSEALPGSGITPIAPLTQDMHSLHAEVIDPLTGMTLDTAVNRDACYRCHPGSQTRCLRGAMGKAVTPNGTMLMQCQNCHGSMSAVGSANRTGWLNEPTCQNCHTGTATSNNGQIRFNSAFDTPGHLRVAANQTFATNQNVPAAGLSLYRFSKGHGGLYCQACHGSTHAEFPTSQKNDNIYSIELQGHEGMLVECTSCHVTLPPTINGGPHGLHPVGQIWVQQHQVGAENSNSAQCAACHGSNFTGTVLSRAQANRTLNAGDFGTKTFLRGSEIGCYNCHNGPGGGDDGQNPNPNRPPVARNASVTTPINTTVAISLIATDPQKQPLTFHIVSQTTHGTVSIVGAVATYYPDPNFAGVDSFTFVASDGQLNSNRGIVTITVNSPFAFYGRVTDSGLGVAGITMTLSSGGTTVAAVLTDTSGAYWFTGLQPAIYVVTPEKPAFLFAPIRRAVAINGSRVPPAQNFNAAWYDTVVLTVKKAVVSALGTVALTNGPLWNISGTATPGARVSVFLGSDVTGQLLGTALPNRLGKWVFIKRVAIPVSLNSVTSISASSTDVQSVLNQSLTNLTYLRVSTRGTLTLTQGPLWNLWGTGVPGTTLSISILKSDLTTSQLIGTVAVTGAGGWRFTARVPDTLPLTAATTLRISSSAGGTPLDVPLTKVLAASVSTRGILAFIQGPLWILRGNGVPGTTINIYLGPDLTGFLIASVTVDQNGNWIFVRRAPVILPIVAKSISVLASSMGTALNQPLIVR